MAQVFRHLPLSCLITLLATHGCSIKPTLDQTTDSLTNLTGTTSSARNWFTNDGLMKGSFKPTAFAFLNYENLRQDLAMGRGEYIASMGTLLGIPDDRQSEFFSAAQVRYPLAAGRDTRDSMALLAFLQDIAAPFVR